MKPGKAPVKTRLANLVVVASIVLLGVAAVAWCLSFWRGAGWIREDEKWVLPGSGMQELHVTTLLSWLVRGRIEVSRSESLRAVIPAGSPAAGEPRRVRRWLWVAAEPARERAWDDRWHLSSWDEWRLGDFGWYESTGGGVTSRVFSVPLWLVMAIVGAPCWLRGVTRLRLRRRRKLGRCLACGYDRRGIAPGVVCPECGKPAQQPPE